MVLQDIWGSFSEPVRVFYFLNYTDVILYTTIVTSLLRWKPLEGWLCSVGFVLESQVFLICCLHLSTTCHFQSFLLNQKVWSTNDVILGRKKKLCHFFCYPYLRKGKTIVRVESSRACILFANSLTFRFLFPKEASTSGDSNIQCQLDQNLIFISLNSSMFVSCLCQIAQENLLKRRNSSFDSWF